MEIEPLPRVTFLPAQLTQLVIQNWSGDVIDYQKNGQVSLALFSNLFCRFVKCSTDKVLASSKMVTSTKENCVMASYTEKEPSDGPTIPSTRVSLERTRLLVKALTSGQTAAPTEVT